MSTMKINLQLSILLAAGYLAIPALAPAADGVGAELIERNAGQLAVAVGLALRSFEEL